MMSAVAAKEAVLVSTPQKKHQDSMKIGLILTGDWERKRGYVLNLSK
jgi:hypothetical protein